MARAANYGIAELHPVSTRSRYTDAKVVRGFGGSRNVGRQSRFGQNLPFSKSIQPENLAACLPRTEKASGNGNKRLTENQKNHKRNGLQTKRDFDASSVSRSFLLSGLLLPQIVGRRQTLLLQENQVPVNR